MSNVRSYALVTTAYWGFTLTDGALRMLVLLHFHSLGYSPLQLAGLFLLYEIFGMVTNLIGGWLGSRMGLNITLFLGLFLQVCALMMLSFLDNSWPTAFALSYGVICQGISGIAKDLTKMSAKSALKLIVPEDGHSLLFKWVALLTGSKNTLKGVGFFLGGLLLATQGFVSALWWMAGVLVFVLLLSRLFLPSEFGKSAQKVKFSALFSKSRAINRLSAARLFLFGARDIWFVVALPLFLTDVIGLSFSQVGALMALWVIGYGLIQTIAPKIIRRSEDGKSTESQQSRLWIALLSLIPFLIIAGPALGLEQKFSVLFGLILFGIVFALNSALHSYLILAFSGRDQVAVNVGFYYMANAAGRLLGTLLSGLVYQFGGLDYCLGISGLMLFISFLFTCLIPVDSNH